MRQRRNWGHIHITHDSGSDGFIEYNRLMRCILWLAILSLALASCQSQATTAITILDGDQIYTLAVSERIPSRLLTEAGITLQPADSLAVDGLPFPLNQTLPAAQHTLQIHRAVALTLVSPAGEQSLLTSTQTVGAALNEAGIQLYAADFLDPPANTPLNTDMIVTYRPSREFKVNVSDRAITIRSSARTIGIALAEAGIPLEGLDYSIPDESEALPADGQIRVVHVSEALTLALKSIPFETKTSSSPEIELGQQQVVQPGLDGLSMSRTRIRYEDGQEISRIKEDESVVRQPQTRIVNTGTKIVMNTTTVDGVTLEYWRALDMYATVYSPCNSGTDECSTGTASGLPAGKGVVAVDPALYSYLHGQRIYVPGYGFARIGDVGGGYIVENSLGISRYRWIDLGFDDNNIVDMTGWLTVYFLAPAPAAIPPALQ